MLLYLAIEVRWNRVVGCQLSGNVRAKHMRVEDSAPTVSSDGVLMNERESFGGYVLLQVDDAIHEPEEAMDATPHMYMRQIFYVL